MVAGMHPAVSICFVLLVSRSTAVPSTVCNLTRNATEHLGALGGGGHAATADWTRPFVDWHVEFVCPPKPCWTTADCGDDLCSLSAPAKEGNALRSSPGFCVCDYYFGWSAGGKDGCTHMLPAHTVRMAGSLFSIVVMFPPLLAWSIQLSLHSLRQKRAQGKSVCSASLLVSSVAAVVGISGTAQCVMIILRMRRVVDADAYDISRAVITSFYANLALATQYFLAIVWMQIALASRTMRKLKNSTKSGTQFVVGIVALLIVAGLPFLVLNRVDLFLVVVAVFNIGFIALAVYGVRKLPRDGAPERRGSLTSTSTTTDDVPARRSSVTVITRPPGSEEQGPPPMSPLEAIKLHARMLIISNIFYLLSALLFTISQRIPAMRFVGTLVSTTCIFNLSAYMMFIVVSYLQRRANPKSRWMACFNTAFCLCNKCCGERPPPPAVVPLPSPGA